MSSFMNQTGCDGTPQGNEQPVAAMGYTPTERALLELMRLYLMAFADPASQAWMRAVSVATAQFGHISAPRIGRAMMNAVNAVRLVRTSPFEFSNPACPGCSRVLCESERQFMGAVTAVLHRQKSSLYAHAMVLCEGEDMTPFLKALSELAVEVPTDRGLPPRTFTAPHTADY